jgi:hypothetical protein
MTPPVLTDCLRPVHTPRTPLSLQRAASPAVVHTIHTPYDGDLIRESSDPIVKQATT